MLNTKQFILSFTFVLLISAVNIFAQSSAFVYQGKLSDGALAANGTYQFEFKLFDAAAGGNQIGNAISNLPATVTNGIFAVTLDFGAGAFDGSPRYLEISVRQLNSGQQFTLLTPRQAITSTPYAVRSLNANQATTADNSANLGGIPAAQYTQNNDARLSDDRNPLPNSPNYIQNTSSVQASSNFNISGTGKANVLEAKTQFNINGERVFHVTGANNVFAGVNAGKNTTGFANAFFGYSAGYLNTTGQDNSFFGQAAGINNTTGSANSFFGNGAGFYNTLGVRNSFYGYLAGQDTTSGSYNAFFGSTSGIKNTTGINNAFVGQASGYNNTVGSNNAFFGNSAGMQNTTGAGNVFLGAQSGESNTTENNNIFIGFKADGSAGITNATAIGANAKATQSNTIVLGTSAVTVQVPGNLTVANTFSANALDSATVYKIGGVRILSNAGTDNLFAGVQSGNANTGNFNAFFGAQSGKANTTGFNNTFVGAYAGRDNTSGANNAFFGASAGLSNNVGAGNSFFGANAGFNNTDGANNSFFGNSAGFNNTGGDNNAFFGRNSGNGNTTGSGNAFFGTTSGQSNTSGGSNTFLGDAAGLLNTTGSFNVFIGKNSAFSNTTGSNNIFVGYNAGNSITNGTDNVFLGSNAGSTGNVFNSIAIGSNVKVASSNTAQIGSATMTVKMPGEVELGKSLQVTGGINVAGLSTFGTNVNVNGSLVVANSLGANGFNLGNGSANQLTTSHLTTINGIVTGLLNAAKIQIHPSNSTSGFVDTMCLAEDDNTLRPCFLVFAEMKNVQEFKDGIDVIKNLRPVTYSQDGRSERAVGLMTTDSSFTDPMFVKRDSNNQASGIRQQQVIPALVGAAQQQQTQIDEQKAENQKLQTEIKELQAELEALKAVVCAQNGSAAVCQPKQ